MLDQFVKKTKQFVHLTSVCCVVKLRFFVLQETEPSAEETPPGLQGRAETAVTASPLLGKNKAEKGRPTNPGELCCYHWAGGHV